MSGSATESQFSNGVTADADLVQFALLHSTACGTIKAFTCRADFNAVSSVPATVMEQFRIYVSYFGLDANRKQ